MSDELSKLWRVVIALQGQLIESNDRHAKLLARVDELERAKS